MFMLKLICCIGGVFILGGVITAFMSWWDKRPIKEEKERPFYITRTYKDIKNGYKD